MERRKGQIMRRVGILAAVMSIFCGGCSADNLLYEGKEKCSVSISDNITITYDKEAYVILTEEVPKDTVGAWVGYVNENISGAMFSTVYLDKKEDCIYVAVNDGFYKAVKAETLEKNQMPMRLDNTEVFGMDESIRFDGIEVNPENGTQLICGDKVYQVTDEELSRERVDHYIASISAYVVFDTDTKQILSQEEYAKIDWDGTKSEGEGRTVWVYTDVWGIKDSEPDSIAVRVNGVYYIAVLLD